MINTIPEAGTGAAPIEPNVELQKELMDMISVEIRRQIQDELNRQHLNILTKRSKEYTPPRMVRFHFDMLTIHNCI